MRGVARYEAKQPVVYFILVPEISKIDCVMIIPVKIELLPVTFFIENTQPFYHRLLRRSSLQGRVSYFLLLVFFENT